MVDVRDLLQMSYYELSPYTGSDGKKRFHIEKITEEQPAQEKDGSDEREPVTVKKLQVSLWHGRFAYDHTPKEEMVLHTEDFSYDGLTAIADWLNREE